MCGAFAFAFQVRCIIPDKSEQAIHATYRNTQLNRIVWFAKSAFKQQNAFKHSFSSNIYISFDGDASNAKRFQWYGTIGVARQLVNKLKINIKKYT